MRLKLFIVFAFTGMLLGGCGWPWSTRAADSVSKPAATTKVSTSPTSTPPAKMTVPSTSKTITPPQKASPPKQAKPAVTEAEQQKVYSLGGKIKLSDLRFAFNFDGSKPEIVAQIFMVENFGPHDVYGLKLPLLRGARQVSLATDPKGWSNGVLNVKHVRPQIIKGQAVYHLKKPLMPKTSGQHPHWVIVVLRYRVPFNFPGHWRYKVPADVVTAAKDGYSYHVVDAGLAGGYKQSYFKVSSTMSSAKPEKYLGVQWKLPISQGTVLHWYIGTGPKFPYSGPPPNPLGPAAGG